MLWIDRQIENSVEGIIMRVQVPIAETDSIVGSLKRRIRTLVAEVGISYMFLMTEKI